MNLSLLGIFLLLGVCAIAWFSQRRRKVTCIDESGISVVRPLAKSLVLPWSEIEAFGVASVALIEEGLHQPGFTQYAGVRLAVSSPRKMSRACADNRRLCDFDVLLTPDYGMSVEQFAAFLESGRSKFKPANQMLEPTTLLVMPRAFARVTPSRVVAHL